MVYHEVLAIKKALQELIKPHGGKSEIKVHHELLNKIREINSSVEKVFLFVKERGNPYKLGERSLTLKNFSCQVMSDKEEVLKHLKSFKLSAAKFNDFREKVYVERTKNNSIIKKNSMKSAKS